MIARPLVSCIIPTYNSEKYLRETLESIVAQTHRPIELLVADDGSSDGTAAVVAELGESSFARSRFVVAPKRGGPAAMRNLGIEHCRGDLVAFVDADDLWLPEKTAMQVARFEEDPSLDVCVSHIQRFRSSDGFRFPPVPGFITTTMLARRSAFERVGLFDTTRWHSDSTDWFLRAREQGLHTCLMPEALTLHRVHGENLSQTKGDDARREFLHLIKQKLDRARRRS